MVLRRSFALSILVLAWVCALGVLAGGASAEADHSGGSAGTLESDPIADPWLSEEGPPVPAPADESAPEERVVAAWRQAPDAAYARAAALRRVRLEYGIGDLLAPARVILESATEDDPDIYTGFARDLAPGVPMIQFEHVGALIRSGDTGSAIRSLRDALGSLARSLPAQLWMIENVSLLLLFVVLGASLGFILLAALQVFPHAAHDLGDLIAGSRAPVFARHAALAALLLLPFAMGEGVVGLALALFALAFAYGKASQRKVLVMAAILLVIGLHPLAQLVSIVTTIVDEDPIAKSVMAVVDRTESRADVERLESAYAEDLVAAHALAYRARRYGLEALSRNRLEALRERVPTDGVVLAGLANIAMRRGETEAAIGLYERAAAQIDSPILLFDLSQAYAHAFRMEEAEATLSRAQRMDADVVAALSGLGDADLVADLPFPSTLLRDRFRFVAMSDHPSFDLAEAFAPGRLGERWFVSASAFALVALFCLLFANRFDHSSRCIRCGDRICTRCQETVWSEELCDDCHHLFQYPDATDPSLRMARLQALSRREVRVNRILAAGAVLVPGMAGLVARRPDFAMSGLLLFGWILAWVIWPMGVFEDPLLMGDAALLGFAIPGVLSVVAYVGIVVTSLAIRKNS